MPRQVSIVVVGVWAGGTGGQLIQIIHRETGGRAVVGPPVQVPGATKWQGFAVQG